MNANDKKALRANLAASLRFAVGDRYVLEIVDSLVNEVAGEIDEFSHGDYTADDVKCAVGRVLCRRLELHGRNRGQVFVEEP